MINFLLPYTGIQDAIILLAMKLTLPDYLNDDPQNVIYIQINLMIVGSLQANEV